MSFALDFSKYIHTVIVTQGSAHLVVIHRQMILLNAPQPRQPRWIDDLEHAGFPTLPRDVVRVPLIGIIQQLLEEVPK